MSTASLLFKSDGVLRETVATITADGNPLTLTVGYQPRKITLYDVAAGTIWKWVQGLPAGSCFKNAAAGFTVDTTSAIVVTSKDTENAAAIAAGTIMPGVTFSGAALVAGHTLIAHFE